MKQIKLTTAALLCGIFVFTSCDKHNNGNNIDNAVYAAFEREFPGATDVSWSTNGNYAVVSFDWNGSRSGNYTDYTAWFEKNTAKFMMHEHDMSFSSIPQTVKTAFEESSYSKSPWMHEGEVDVIVKNDEGLTLYVIEVEKEENGTETEADLYYSEDGVLVKEVIDADKNQDFTQLLPTQPANDVYSWVESKYPGAVIVDIDHEDECIEVEFILENIKHDAMLTSANKWIYTKKDYNRNSSKLPAEALNFIQTNYPNYGIEDIEYYETASKGNFYSVEIEGSHDNDIELYFDTKGNKMESKPDFSDETGGGISTDSSIQNLIDERYPGAIITDKDYDDGLTEIEIRHDGIEKDVYFNGKNEWVRTEYEIKYNSLPEVVKSYISSNYRDYDDDAKVVETTAETWYEIEAEKNGSEYNVLITKEGQLKAEYKD